MATVNFETIIQWCKDNWIILLLVGGIIFLVIMYMRKKPHFKPINRSEILRNEFIKRNNKNYSPLKFAYRGNVLFGRIKYLNAIQLDDKDKGQIDAVELVIKPCLFGFKSIPDFFSKDFCIIVNRENCDFDYAGKWFEINPSTTFDWRAGVYYDRDNKDLYIKYIKDRLVISEDWESLSAVYYKNAMEQSTLHEPNAITIQSKQLDLEAEKEKRKHLVS